MNILQYESKIWATADLLRGSGIKESEWPSFMMPFFALVMIESRLIRMLDELKEEIGEDAFNGIQQEDLYDLIKDKGQGYNIFLFEKTQSLSDICKNDKSFEIDFDAYLKGFDGETKDLLGVDAGDGEKFLDIRGVITKLKAKKVLLGYTKLWAEIDLKPFNNSEITTLEEHIKRKWADISAETAGEQYTPDDVIALISEIAASKLEDSDKLLKIYDCTCGGGNLLFGVEDRINQKFKRLTQTYGQDWNDALYALAKIESRFRPDSKIEHGNTLVDDKFDNEEFDVVIANAPYGVSWSGYSKDIQNDKTERFKFLPSISDGQLLFMQHLVSKLDANGIGVVVHNGSTLFSGDAGSAESNIRKWMLENNLVEAVIQLPTDEFFNTSIHTYLWVLNKNREQKTKDKVMLIDVSKKWTELKKSKGSKKKEIAEAERLDIVQTLMAYQDNDYAKVFNREHFYFNKQAILLTNTDINGLTFESHLPEKEDKKTGEMKRAASLMLSPVSLTSGDRQLNKFSIAECDIRSFDSLFDYFERDIKPFIARLDYKEQALKVSTYNSCYYYDHDQATLVKKDLKTGEKESLGCGKIVIKSSYKKPTKKLPERIEITVELTPDYQKDYEIIPFHKESDLNQQAIEAFMAKYIYKPFKYLENVVGVEINFNKIFYSPASRADINALLNEVSKLSSQLSTLQHDIKTVVLNGVHKTTLKKNSGVDWIGNIPERWNVIRVKEISKIINGSTPKSKVEAYWDGDISWVTTDDLGKLSSKYITRTKRTLTKEGYSSCGTTICPAGSVVISGRAPIGHLGILEIDACTNQGCKTLVIDRNKIHNLYLYYCLQAAKPKLESLGRGTTFIELSTKELSLFMIPLPSMAEQVEISEYIENVTVKIDSIVTKIDEYSSLLKRLKYSFVNDVSSGDLILRKD
jgi:type I restriction enzyme M protein